MGASLADRSIRIWGVALLALSACSSSPVTPGADASAEGAAKDAGARRDAHAGSNDSGAHDATEPPPDAGPGKDAGSSDAVDEEGGESGADGGVDAGCTTDLTCPGGSICAVDSGACVSAACTADAGPCANPADICCAGYCASGNCCTSADCANDDAGTICGAGGENVCGKCKQDVQCQLGDAGDVCDTDSGLCVANSSAFCADGGAAAAGGAPGVCTVNAGDQCCKAASGCKPSPGANACCPGSGANAYCVSVVGAGAVCDTSAGVCTTCAPLTGTVYLVDPTAGSDAEGTGSGTTTGTTNAPACDLQTITRALALIGTPTTATTIELVGSTHGSKLASTETYPIVIPANVSISVKSGEIIAEVPAGVAGFELSSPTSSLSAASGASLTITTTITGTGATAKGGKNGIVVTTGSSSSTTKISNLTVQGMLSDGILVNGSGGVAIGEGVVSTGNGAAGLDVTGTGDAVIDVGSGKTPSQFDGNKSYGILVTGSGSVQATGSITDATTGTGTVTANANATAGILIKQDPTTPPENKLTGVVGFGTTAGNGLAVYGGSSVVVRKSAFLGSSKAGVYVGTYTSGMTTDVTLSSINLGTANSSGDNTFQSTTTGAANKGTGICIATTGSTATLSAAGNVFDGSNCSTATDTLTLSTTGCAVACAGAPCDLALASSSVTNKFNVKTCTQ